MQLPSSTLTATLIHRRATLAIHLGDTPALISSGYPSPRNYSANVYPFRPSSHFLYLAGTRMAGAQLLIDGGQATLFIKPPPPGDDLWHGPSPSPAMLTQKIGCPVRPLSDLPALLKNRAVGSLPGADARSRFEAATLLNRNIDRPTDADARLAEGMIALRLIHDAPAEAELRHAATITTRAHRAGMAATHPGLGESAIHAVMAAEIMREGMELAYGPIVTVHGEVLHAHSHHGILAEGDLLLADVGAESLGGWAADVTRTWPVSGQFSPTQRAIYEVVLAAERAAIEATRPGARYRDIHLKAALVITEGLVDLGILRGTPEDLVADDVHALFFPHGVGHLLGLDVHDMEDLGDRAGYAPGRTRSDRFGLGFLRLDRDLAPGMLVTIEPGFYQVPAILTDPARLAQVGDRLDLKRLADFADVRGIRIEDDVLVTETGCEVLTADAPTDPDAIEALISG